MRNLKKKSAWKAEYGDAFIGAALQRIGDEEEEVVAPGTVDNLFSHLRQLMNYVVRIFKRVDWKRIIGSPPNGCPISQILDLLKTVSTAGIKLTRILVCKFVKLVVPALQWVRSLFENDGVQDSSDLTAIELKSLDQTEKELKNCITYLESWGDLMIKFVVGLATRLIVPFTWIKSKMTEAIGKIGSLIGDMVLKVTSSIHIPESIKVYGFQFLTLIASVPGKVLELYNTYGSDIALLFNAYVEKIMAFLQKFVEMIGEMFSLKSLAATARLYLRALIESPAWKAFDYTARLVNESLVAIVDSLRRWAAGYMACGTEAIVKFLQSMALHIAKSYALSVTALTTNVAIKALLSDPELSNDITQQLGANTILRIEPPTDISAPELHQLKDFLSSLSYPGTGQAEFLDAAQQRYLEVTEQMFKEARRRTDARKQQRFEKAKGSVLTLVTEDIGDVVEASGYLAQRLFDAQWTELTNGTMDPDEDTITEGEARLTEKYTLFEPEEQELFGKAKQIYTADIVRGYREIAKFNDEGDQRVMRRTTNSIDGSTVMDVSSIGAKNSEPTIGSGPPRRKSFQIVSDNNSKSPVDVVKRTKTMRNRVKRVRDASVAHGSVDSRKAMEDLNNVEKTLRVLKEADTKFESLNSKPPTASEKNSKGLSYLKTDRGIVGASTLFTLSIIGLRLYMGNNGQFAETNEDIFRKFWRRPDVMGVDNFGSTYSSKDPDRNKIMYDCIQSSRVPDFASKDPKLGLAAASLYFNGLVNDVLENVPSVEAMLEFLADDMHGGKNKSIIKFVTDTVNKGKGLNDQVTAASRKPFVASDWGLDITVVAFDAETLEVKSQPVFLPPGDTKEASVLSLPSGVAPPTAIDRFIPVVPESFKISTVQSISSSYDNNVQHSLEVPRFYIVGGTTESSVKADPSPGFFGSASNTVLSVFGMRDEEAFERQQVKNRDAKKLQEKAEVREALQERFEEELSEMNRHVEDEKFKEALAKRDASLENNLSGYWSKITSFSSTSEGSLDIILALLVTASAIVTISLIFWAATRLLVSVLGITEETPITVIKELLSILKLGIGFGEGLISILTNLFQKFLLSGTASFVATLGIVAASLAAFFVLDKVLWVFNSFISSISTLGSWVSYFLS